MRFKESWEKQQSMGDLSAKHLSKTPFATRQHSEGDYEVGRIILKAIKKILRSASELHANEQDYFSGSSQFDSTDSINASEASKEVVSAEQDVSKESFILSVKSPELALPEKHESFGTMHNDTESRTNHQASLLDENGDAFKVLNQIKIELEEFITAKTKSAILIKDSNHGSTSNISFNSLQLGSSTKDQISSPDDRNFEVVSNVPEKSLDSLKNSFVQCLGMSDYLSSSTGTIDLSAIIKDTGSSINISERTKECSSSESYLSDENFVKIPNAPSKQFETFCPTSANGSKISENLNQKNSLRTSMLMLDKWVKKGLFKRSKSPENDNLVDCIAYAQMELVCQLGILKNMIARVQTLIAIAEHLPNPGSFSLNGLKSKTSIQIDLIISGAALCSRLKKMEADVYLDYTDVKEMYSLKTLLDSSKLESKNQAAKARSIIFNSIAKMAKNYPLLNSDVIDFQYKICVFVSEIEKLQ